jgi:hypothetical protein
MGGRKSNLAPYAIIISGDMSQTLTSPACPINLQDHIWFQCEWTGNPNGTFYVDASDNGTSWVQAITSLALDLSPAAIELSPTAAHFVRLRFVPGTGSTGTLQARLSGKML